MINRGQHKLEAKNALRGKWGTGVIMAIIYLAISSALASMPVINIMIMSVFSYGMVIAYLKLIRIGTYDITDFFSGFKNFVSSALLGLITALFTMLWSFMLIVPGIIAATSYSMAYYILADNPDMEFMTAISESKKMTNGYKMEIFVLYLSFLGWAILSCLTFGIGFLWLIPYQQATFASVYERLKNEVQPIVISVE